jgi:hypothetical protein
VSFPTANSTVVADLNAASSSDAVVLAHGAAFDKATWAPFASWLAGRRALQRLVLLRSGHNESG